MKNIKMKLTIAMISTTVILFAITILVINFYQKNYIFDKAILSIENELRNFQDDEYLIEIEQYEQRLFDVEIVELEPNDYDFQLKEDLYYFDKEENSFRNLYIRGDIQKDDIVKVTNEFGQYYVLIIDLPQNALIDTDSEADFPVIMYTDITAPTNIIYRLNVIFAIMLFIVIIVEGIVGIYLGTRFENSQSKLKHFFQNASHELKTPLMSIEGYAQGIKTGVIQDKVMASDVIIKQSQKMKLLVDEILNISKLDSREYTLKKEVVDIRDIVEQSLENYETLIDEKGIHLVVDIDEQNSEMIADAMQIYKAVNTIIDNAFKFALSKIHIKTYVNKSYLFISVYNDGKSITAKKAKHIFDRFYSVNDVSTGIGLAMAKEILVLSGGDIVLKNVTDGVIFEMKVPRNK